MIFKAFFYDLTRETRKSRLRNIIKTRACAVDVGVSKRSAKLKRDHDFHVIEHVTLRLERRRTRYVGEFDPRVSTIDADFFHRLDSRFLRIFFEKYKLTSFDDRKRTGGRHADPKSREHRSYRFPRASYNRELGWRDASRGRRVWDDRDDCLVRGRNVLLCVTYR